MLLKYQMDILLYIPYRLELLMLKYMREQYQDLYRMILQI